MKIFCSFKTSPENFISDFDPKVVFGNNNNKTHFNYRDTFVIIYDFNWVVEVK